MNKKITIDKTIITDLIIENQRGCNSVIKVSSTDMHADLGFGWLDSITVESNSPSTGCCGTLLLCRKNAGSEGMGRVSEELLSIIKTEAMVGLLAMFSWTHSSAMWIHLIISQIELKLVLNVGSMRLAPFPSIQLFQACNCSTCVISLTCKISWQFFLGSVTHYHTSKVYMSIFFKDNPPHKLLLIACK